MTVRNELGVKKGDTVKAFHPKTLGVVKHGTVVGLGRTWVRVDFGLLNGGVTGVRYRDILEVLPPNVRVSDARS